MGKVTLDASEVPETPIVDFVGTVEIFKFLYMDWLRFFRENMSCGWECPGACPLDEECPEIQKVWDRWLETLSEVQRGLVD
jgi:hypothetical protein